MVSLISHESCQENVLRFHAHLSLVWSSVISGFISSERQKMLREKAL
jgi:hypothetical protein